MQATSAFTSAGAAAPEEFYDAYSEMPEARSHRFRAWQRFKRHRLALLSLVILVIVFGAGLLAPDVAPATYQQVHVDALSSAPSWAHPFGTDQIGRDYFSRVLYGLHTEVEIVLIVGFVGTLVGMLLGAIPAYFGGTSDMAVMRFTDVMLTLPPLITVLVAAAYLQTNTLVEVSVVLGCLMWMPIARIARSTTLSLREREYVEAARAMGASDLRIIRKHILPNALSSVIVAATVMMAGAVILETTMSFLGLNLPVRYYAGRTDTTLPSIGDVMAAASGEGVLNWWGILFPGLVVILIIAPIYFVGDGIRDAFDPTQRRHVRPPRPPGRVAKLVRRVPWPSLPEWERPEVSIRLPRLRLPGLAVRRPRRRRRLHVLVEAVLVLAVTAGAAAAVYAWKVNPVRSSWALAGTDVTNISRASGAQTEIAVAAHGDALFAASNDTLLRTIRVYSSADGGRSWTSTPGPPLGGDACARGEPATTIDARGREYVAFVVNGFCTQYDPQPYIVVAVRSSPAAKWHVQQLAPRRLSDGWDDKPALAAAPDGRVYVAWSRLLKWTYQTTVVSSTNDGGRTWTKPRIVDRRLSNPQLAALSVSPDGTLYLAGVDARFGVWLARSRHGKVFRLARVSQLPFNRAGECTIAGNHPTPFQASRCVGPNPTVAATSSRVYVVYGAGWVGQPQSVHVGVFDPKLRRLAHRAVASPVAKADRFWPTSAVDPQTGRLWVCFYDTSGDPSGEQAWFTCTSSRDARRWSSPVRAGADSSSSFALWEDARVYLFGDTIGYGGNTGLVVSRGVAHPLWVDTNDRSGRKQEIFGATLR
ncbi:MAG: ABC transporter permease subunit [Gaiellaceae bacterium]